MRHRKKTVKLGRTAAHRDALMANLVCNLIVARRIRTTVAKAKAARSVAEKMVTLGKKGTLAARRRAVSKLHRTDAVGILFEEIAPSFKDRAGGYTRITKLGRRPSDSSEMAILEWVDQSAAAGKGKAGTAKKAAAAKKPAAEAKPPAKKKAVKKKAPAKTAQKADEPEKKAGKPKRKPKSEE
jgi:large subunit ribosomal protein L17